MIRLFAAICAFALSITQPVNAEPRSKQGFGLMITNDVLGDTRDRWRTGSFESSWVFAPTWRGQAPTRFGELIELRINGEIVAPANLAAPAPRDRRYGQAIAVGLHTHFQPRAVEYAVGLDAYVTGPQVGLDDVQESVHDVLGGRNVSPPVRAVQVSDDVYACMVAEAGRRFDISGNVVLRPFVEARGGVETLVRTGFDLTIGQLGRNSLLVRTPVTGHRLSVVEGVAHKGVSFVMGADMAFVDNSIWVPAGGLVRLNDIRTRVRAGGYWRSRGGSSLFYGLTWLSKEFNTQPESQIVGALQLRLRF